MNRVAERLRELSDDLQRIGAGRHHDPHQILGRHDVDGQAMVLAYLPGIRLARLERRHEMRRIRGTDVFAWICRRIAGCPGSMRAARCASRSIRTRSHPRSPPRTSRRSAPVRTRAPGAFSVPT